MPSPDRLERAPGYGLLDDLHPAGVDAEPEAVTEQAVHGGRDEDLVGAGGELEPERARSTGRVGQDLCVRHTGYGA